MKFFAYLVIVEFSIALVELHYKIKLLTSLFSLTVGDSGGVSDTKDFDFAIPLHSGLVLKELCLCKIVKVKAPYD